MRDSNDGKPEKQQERSAHIVEMKADRTLFGAISRRSGGNPFEQSSELARPEQALVLAEDLRSFYTLVEEAGEKEVRDLFSVAEAGALISACGSIELSGVDPAGLSAALQSGLPKDGALEYWGVDALPVLGKLASLSPLARYFLLWRLDEQARLTAHHPTRETISLVLEDMGLRSRDWGEGGLVGDAPRLYSASVEVPELSGYKDVSMTLLRHSRPRPVVPYSALLGNYCSTVDDGMDVYLEGAVDELFTKREAEYVKRYIEDAYGLEVSLCERNSHDGIDIGTMGETALPVGGGRGMVILGGPADPELPFLVAGCYDLRMHEFICEGDTAKEESAPLGVADAQES